MRILIPTAFFLIVFPFVSSAYKSGPSPHMAGGFGDDTCHACHLDNPINDPGGMLTVTGVPQTYQPGRRYQITIGLQREGLRRGGFEIVARYRAGELVGRQAGAWRPVDDRVQLIPSDHDPSLIFAQHNTAGSLSATRGSSTWTVEWIAPVSGGPIQFNVAGNASNDDASPLGDYIYVDTLASRPATVQP